CDISACGGCEASPRGEARIQTQHTAGALLPPCDFTFYSFSESYSRIFPPAASTSHSSPCAKAKIVRKGIFLLTNDMLGDKIKIITILLHGGTE
ncbi:MAG: hypothetical protein IJN63_06665, partial [Clostridia bacterium]|nr:hypothetical protein [Clostridia bacterium]